MLNQIKANESGGNYTLTITPQQCQALNGPNAVCTASGAYQFINATWQSVAAQTGIGTDCPTAASCPPAAQDANALFLLRKYGPNATQSWAASAPAGGYQPLVDNSGAQVADVSGSGAAAPTQSIMDALTAQAANIGVDLTDPTTEIVVAAAGLLTVLLLVKVI